MPYLQILGVPHFYSIASAPGKAEETLVFIHGWLLSHHYWSPVCQGLSDRYTCISYDLRGFGASNQGVEARHPSPHNALSPSPYSLAAYADDLAALLAHLKIESAWLVGHSLGGSIALWAAQKLPEQIKGVICVNAGGGIYLPQEFKRFRQAGAQLVRWRFPWLQRIPLLDWGFARMMVAQALTRQWGKQRLQDFLVAHSEAALGSLLASTTEGEVHRLPRIVAGLQQPVYFVAGAQDQVMAARYVEHLASFHRLFQTLLGNVTVLPNCGHMAMVEKPDQLVACIRHYLMGEPAGNAPTLTQG
ncbi:MAG: alpha/beta hydrolase [Cyanobacteria bacterium]|nr:alpha/beta hydrolase [Cyanobacteriota bacterium]